MFPLSLTEFFLDKLGFLRQPLNFISNKMCCDFRFKILNNWSCCFWDNFLLAGIVSAEKNNFCIDFH